MPKLKLVKGGKHAPPSLAIRKSRKTNNLVIDVWSAKERKEIKRLVENYMKLPFASQDMARGFIDGLNLAEYDRRENR